MPKPSAVLDTNVVVSAHLKDDGLERFVLDLALTQKIKCLISDAILEEYRNVLMRPKFRIDPAKASASLRLMEQASTRVRPLKQVKVAKDPDDNKFLECAQEGQADYVVTGNKKHFPKRWGLTLIVNAKEFLQQITPDLKR